MEESRERERMSCSAWGSTYISGDGRQGREVYSMVQRIGQHQYWLWGKALPQGNQGQTEETVPQTCKPRILVPLLSLWPFPPVSLVDMFPSTCWLKCHILRLLPLAHLRDPLAPSPDFSCHPLSSCSSDHRLSSRPVR